MKNELIEVLLESLPEVQSPMEVCDFKAWSNSVIKRLEGFEGSGLRNVGVSMESTLEPYECNYPGPVSVEIWGERPMTKQEAEGVLKKALAEKLAKDLGTYLTAAEEIQKLIEEGKLCLPQKD